MTDRLDPLETSRQIEESYKRYLKTLLSPRDGKLAEAFDAEIDATSMLTKGPMLELTPPYETGATPRHLVERGLLHTDFPQLGLPATSRCTSIKKPRSASSLPDATSSSAPARGRVRRRASWCRSSTRCSRNAPTGRSAPVCAPCCSTR